jgi:diadenosine tetraphosphatase ApaH/serine/threonine PP2A family protein phosphatase
VRLRVSRTRRSAIGGPVFYLDEGACHAGQQGVPPLAGEGGPIRRGRQATLAGAGSPRKINEYLFEDRPISSFQRLAASSNADIIVFGHTHKPYTKLVDNVLFVNAGSVGKPKDGDWHACYAVLEPGAAKPVEFVRVEYDLKTVTTATRQSELPDVFAADLETGGVRSPHP